MRFICLRSYDNYITANLHMQRLEAEGIRTYLQDENTVTINPVLSNAIGGIKLMVHEGQVERASQLLAQIEEEYRKSFACPRCGAHDIHHVPNTRKAVNWITAISTWLFSNYAVSPEYIYRCFKCGYEMESLSEQ